jgi:hypothetical protein
MRHNSRLKKSQLVILGFILAVTILPSSYLVAQQPTQVTVPVPARILSAKKIFVGNAGGEEWAYGEPPYKGGAERAYDEFYAALKAWGHYEIVSDPSDADLLVEISFMTSQLRPVISGDSISSSAYDPQFHLVIRDAKTNALLWGLTEHAQWAILQSNLNKNFGIAIGRLVAEMQRISAPAADSDSTLSKP